MYILLLVCWAACETCYISFSSEDGGSIKIYYYETENNCQDQEVCVWEYGIHGGCNDLGDNEYLSVNCTGEDVVELWGCPDGDEDCSNCDDKSVVEGGCKEDDDGNFVRVEGCSDVDNNDNQLLEDGGIMMGIGLFPCCLFALFL